VLRKIKFCIIPCQLSVGTPPDNVRLHAVHPSLIGADLAAYCDAF
jgi:hypothetical protein